MMEIKLNNYTTDSNWVKGTVNNEYQFQAKLYDEGSKYGINEGRISKLSISDGYDEIVNYDRGWDIEPKSEEHGNLMNGIVDYCDGLPRSLDVI